MADAKLGILISADTSQAQAGLRQFNDVLNQTPGAAANAQTGINNVSTAYVKQQAVVKQLIPVVSNFSKATTDLNIPLSEQKQILQTLQQQYARLNTTQAQSSFGKSLAADIKLANAEIKRLEAGAVDGFGAVGQAATKGFSVLRRLAFILPGIGIAGIFNLAFQGISELFGGVSAQSDELKKKLTELIVPIQSIKDAATGGEQGDISKVTALSNAVLNQTLSYKERNAALTQLKEINKGYFGDLTLETAALGLLKTRVDEYTQALISQAVIKGFQDQISKLAPELTEQQKAFGLTVDKVADLAKQFGISGDAVRGFATALKGIEPTGSQLKGFRDLQNNLAFGKRQDLQDAIQQFNDQADVVAKLKVQFGDLSTSIQEAVDASLKLKPLDAAKLTKDVESEINKIIEQGKKLVAEFGNVNKIHLSILPEFSALDTKAEQLAKAQKVIADVSSFFTNFSSKQRPLNLSIPFEPIPIVEPLDSQVKAETQAEITKILQGVADFKPQASIAFDPVDLTKFDSSLSQELIKLSRARALNLELGVAVKINPQFDATQVTSSLQKALTSLNEGFITVLGDFEKNLAVAVGQGIGDAITSGGDFTNLFKGIFNAVGGALEQLGETLIATAVGLQAIKAAFKTLNPAVALAAGIGLIALGEIIKNSIGKIGQFAEGGRPEVGKQVLTAERGIEWFIPDAPGAKPVMLGKDGPQMFTPTMPGKIVPNYNLGSVKDKTSELREAFYNTDTASNLRESFVSTNSAAESFRSNNNVSTLKESFLNNSNTSNLKESLVTNNKSVDKSGTDAVSTLKESLNNNASFISNYKYKQSEKYFDSVKGSDYQSDSTRSILSKFKESFVNNSINTSDSAKLNELFVTFSESNNNRFFESFNNEKQLLKYFSDSTTKGTFKSVIHFDNVRSASDNLKESLIVKDSKSFNDSANILSSKLKESLISPDKNYHSDSTESYLSKLVESVKTTDSSQLSKVMESFSDSKMVEQLRSVINNKSTGHLTNIEKIREAVNNNEIRSVDGESDTNTKSYSIDRLVKLVALPDVSGSQINNTQSYFRDSHTNPLTSFIQYLSNVINSDTDITKLINSVVPHRQFGGIAVAGQPIIVGETGRELFVPHANGTIIPAGNLNGLQGNGQHIDLGGTFKILGRDLELILARQKGFDRRNT